MRNRKYVPPTPLTPEQQAAQQLERDRRAWATALRNTRVEARQTAIQEMIAAATLLGEVRKGSDYLEVRRGNVSATLYARVSDYGFEDRLRNPDNKDQVIYTVKPEVYVSWPSYGSQELIQCFAAVELMQELLKLAVAIQAVVSYGPTISFIDSTPASDEVAKAIIEEVSGA